LALPRAPGRDAVTAFRGTLLVLCAALSVLASAHTCAALPIAVLGCVAPAGAHSRTAGEHPLALGVFEAAVAEANVVLTGGSESPMLPFLVAPPGYIALREGSRGAIIVSGAAAAALLLTGTSSRRAPRCGSASASTGPAPGPHAAGEHGVRASSAGSRS